MNKILLTLGLLLSLSCTASFAQHNGISVGLEGGPSRSNLWGNDWVEKEKYTKRADNFSTGASFEYHFTKLLSLRSGLAFERKGVTYQVQHSDDMGYIIAEVPGRMNFDYLMLPLMARVTLGNKFICFANAGPYLGYLLQRNDVEEGSGPVPRSSVRRMEGLRRLDMGFSAGLGAGVAVTDQVLFTLEARHNLGLYNISKTPVYNDGTVKMKSTNLLAGIAYKLKS